MQRKSELIIVSIDELNLDINNPRIIMKYFVPEDQITEEVIIDYLREQDNLDDLKNLIEKEGWDPPYDPWVLQEDGKYIVKEGNRRVAALKLLKQENKNIPNGIPEQIYVSLYHDIEDIKKHITKVHDPKNNVEPWTPWAKAADDMVNNRKTKKAHIFHFIITNNLKREIVETDWYTVLEETLSKTKDTGIWLDDAKFHYDHSECAKLLINELFQAYSKKKFNTRTRKEIDKILNPIEVKLSKCKEKHAKQSTRGDLFTNDVNDESEQETDPEGQKSVHRRRFPDKIKDKYEFKAWIEKLQQNYDKKNNHLNSYLILGDMRCIITINSYPNTCLILCRVFWESLLREYYNVFPTEAMPDKIQKREEIETKSINILQSHSDKIKQEFPEIKDVSTHATKYVGILNDVVHGIKYYNNDNQLFSVFQGMYPFLFFLTGLINGKYEKESDKSES